MKKTAFITGGSRGIGYGIATCLAKEGWNLLINGMRPEGEVREAIAALANHGVKSSYVRGDLGTAEGRAAMITAARTLVTPTVNLLVNNAGVAPKERRDLLEMSEESYDRVMGTNLRGAIFLTQALAKDMIAARRADPSFAASIVNISSISATVASVNRAEYCIAKAGLSMMTSLFAARLGEEGIPVYEIRPGITRTDMTAGVTEKYDKLIAEGLCVQPRWGTPEDVGKAVAALARGDFPYSTGQAIGVDGGLTLPRL